MCAAVLRPLRPGNALRNAGLHRGFPWPLGKETARIKAYTSLCCCGSLFIGFLFLLIVLLCRKADFPGPFGADGDTLSPYLQLPAHHCAGRPVILFNNVFANIIRADGAAKESMIANILGTLSNIGLDALFILVFSWDVAGAALATVLGT